MLFANREFRYLYSGLLLSYVGDQLAVLAVAVLVFDRTGSGLLTGLAYASAFLPAIVAGPLLGPFADRLPRRSVLIGCDLIRGALVLALIIPGMPIWALITLLFAGHLCTPPFVAARSALLPEILPAETYVMGNGLAGITHQLSQVAGFAAGGLVVAAVGAAGALAFNAGTFAVSAVLLAAGLRRRPAPAPGGGGGTILGDARAGLRYVLTDPWLRGCLLLVWTVPSFAFAPEAIAYPYARQLGGTPTLAGLILATTALGYTAGAALLTRVARVRDRLIVPFAVLAGLALVPLAFGAPIAVVLALLSASGVGCAFATPLNALFVQRVSHEYRGRAMGVAIAGITAGQGIGLVIAGALTSLGLNPGITYSLCGAAAVASAGTAGLAWRRNVRRSAGLSPAV